MNIKLKFILFSVIILLLLILAKFPLSEFEVIYDQWITDRRVESKLESMSLEEKIGQMFFPAITGNTFNDSHQRLLEEVQPGGLIFFPYNLGGLTTSQQFIQSLQKNSNIPMFIAIDQEGGLVQKLKEGISEVVDFPGAMAIGATGSEELSYQMASAMAEELKTVGFNTVFAPDLDVNSNPKNPIIGIRSFGSDPKRVAKLGKAFIKGLQSQGVIAVGKHFPGHGDTAQDTHIGTVTLPYDRERLYQLELIPFHTAIENNIEILMTAHITLPKIVSSGLPATLAPEILTDLLRNEWGYEGLIVTDAMNMKAIIDHFGKVESNVMAVKAGADLILMPVDPYLGKKALIQAARSGQITEERIDQSVRRILSLKIKNGLFDLEDSEGDFKIYANMWQEHAQLAQKIADQAVTLVKKNEKSMVPLSLNSNETFLVVTPLKSVTETYVNELKKTYPTAKIQSITKSNLILSNLDFQKVRSADWVLVATNSRLPSSRKATHPQMVTVKKIWEMKGEEMIWASLQTPYELSSFKEPFTYLAQYGYNPSNCRGLIHVLTGQAVAKGELPVALP